MARNLSEVIASVPSVRLAKIAADRRDKLIVAEEHRLIAEKQKRLAVEKWRRLEEVKRVMELDRNLIAIAAVITALPIIAALAWMLTALAVGGR
jgi:hypothetical protein